MTDSQTDDKRGRERGVDVGPTADEVFGEVTSDAGVTSDESGREDRSSSDATEDKTAADVFGEIQNEIGDGATGTDELLDDETPETIMERADEPDGAAAEADDLVVDEDALDELLLTDRKEGDEFLWIVTGTSSDDEDTRIGSESDTSDAASNGDTSDSATNDASNAPADESSSAFEGESPTDGSDREEAESETATGEDRTGEPDEATESFSEPDSPPQSPDGDPLSTIDVWAGGGLDGDRTAERRDSSAENSSSDAADTDRADTGDDTTRYADDTGDTETERAGEAVDDAREDESGGRLGRIRSKLPL